MATVNQLAQLEHSVDFKAGATLPLAGLTGRQAVDALNVKAGDRVLVTGALGAVGRVAVRYLRELGAVPVAGVRAERVAEARSLAGEALAIGTEGEKGSFDAAVDAVGGPVASAAIELVRDDGILAAVAGAPDGANANGRITITNIFGTENSATLQAVADAAARGELSIPVVKTFKLSQVTEAYTALAGGQVGGKIVLVP